MSWFGLVYVETYMCLGVYISGYNKICIGFVYVEKSRCLDVYIYICISGLVWFGLENLEKFRCLGVYIYQGIPIFV